jgi:type IV fimbrial biogenesis protein FimT
MFENLSISGRAAFRCPAPFKEARRRQRGFTIIEIMVVMAIIAILATLAIPSFVGLIANASISRTANGFVSDTRYARGEAMRRGKSVTICRTADATATGVSDFFAVGVASTAPVATGNGIIFDATGRAVGQSGRWLVHATGSLSANNSYTRTLCMNSVGRVRIQQGDVAC